MNDHQKKQTEIQKLNHVLQIKETDDFSFLEKLTKAELNQLRLQILDENF